MLFIPIQASQITALRTVIAPWPRLAIFEAMSQKEGAQRLWFTVDKLDALGTTDGLQNPDSELVNLKGDRVRFPVSNALGFLAKQHSLIGRSLDAIGRHGHCMVACCRSS